MQAQQRIDITHDLLSLFLLLFFSFLQHYNKKTLHPIIHHKINSSTDNILKGSQSYMHHKHHYFS